MRRRSISSASIIFNICMKWKNLLFFQNIRTLAQNSAKFCEIPIELFRPIEDFSTAFSHSFLDTYTLFLWITDWSTTSVSETTMDCSFSFNFFLCSCKISSTPNEFRLYFQILPILTGNTQNSLYCLQTTITLVWERRTGVVLEKTIN